MKNLLILLINILSVFTAKAQWHQVNSNTTEDISQMVFIDINTGFFVSGNSIYKTIDTGENWTNVFNQNNLNIHSIGVVNNEIYAFAKQNIIDKLILSSDNGNTWALSNTSYSPINVQTVNNNIYMLDTSDDYTLKKINITGGLVSLEKKGFYGIHQDEIIIVSSYTELYKSTDYGQNWSALSGFPNNFTGNNASWSQIKSFGDTIVLTASYGASVHLSKDNGNTWETIYHENIPTPNIILDSGYIYGTIGCNEEEGTNFSCITGSSDYGQTWELVQTGLQGDFLDYRFYFYNNDLGFAYTNNGIIYKTNNGGGLSVPQLKNTEKKIKVYPNPAKNILQIETTGAVSVQKLYLTDMSGKTVKSFPKESRLLDVSGLPIGNYFLQIVGEQGKTLKKIMVK